MMIRWRFSGRGEVSCRLASFSSIEYLVFFPFVFHFPFVCLLGGCALVRAESGAGKGGLGWDYHFYFYFQLFFCIVCLFAVDLRLM